MDVQTAADNQADRASEAEQLIARFSLLEQQYTSDLARLGMVKEAGTPLGYFDADACVFCGASPQYQSKNHAVYEAAVLAESVDAEIIKTLALKSGLTSTIDGISAYRDAAVIALSQPSGAVEVLDSSIRLLDDRIRPTRTDLRQLIERRSEVERQIGLWERLEELEALRASVAQESPASHRLTGSTVSFATRRDLSNVLNRILRSWNVPVSEDAYFDFNNPEIVTDERRRVNRGKGMRSILHTAFSIALAEYCLERELPHPGFVALDTPLLTYRDANRSVAGGMDDEELVSQSVTNSFYEYLLSSCPVQVVVIENQEPPAIDQAGCSLIYFSGAPDVLRSGFYTE